MATMLKFYKDTNFNIYLKANTTNEPRVFIYSGSEFKYIGNMTQIDTNLFKFEDIKNKEGEYLYKITVDKIVKYVRVIIEENLLSILYNYTVGSWEIKDNKMLFYDTNNNLIGTYNLYDRNGNPTELAPYKRELVNDTNNS